MAGGGDFVMAAVDRALALPQMMEEFAGGCNCSVPTRLGINVVDDAIPIVNNPDLTEVEKWFGVFGVIGMTPDELFGMATKALTTLDACIRLIKKEKSLGEGYLVVSPETIDARKRCVRLVKFFAWLAGQEWNFGHYPEKQRGLAPDVRDLTVPEYFLELEEKHEGNMFLQDVRKAIFPTHSKSAHKV